MKYYIIDSKNFSSKDKTYYTINVLCTDHNIKYFVKKVFVSKETYQEINDNYSIFDDITDIISVNINDNGYSIIINL